MKIVENTRRKAISSKLSKINARELNLMHDLLVVGRLGITECAERLGLHLISELLENDRARLCGKPNERDLNSHVARWGYKESSCYLGGGKVHVDRPRIRDLDKEREIELPLWDRLQDPRYFNEEVFKNMIHGVSTRDYKATLDQTIKRLGISKSKVDRAFIHKAMKHWQDFQTRDLSGIDAWAILIDGIYFGTTSVGISAMAFDTIGEKHPLGFWEGSTESSENVMALFRDLESRGFKINSNQLFILDGGGGVIKAVENRIGKEIVLIQRCFIHKLRNLKEYLPKNHHWKATYMLHLIRDAATEAQAKDHLRKMLLWLKDINISAYNSLNEAAPYLTTAQRLNVPQELRKSVQSTNCIESMFSIGPRKVFRNVKRWRNSKQRQRYLAIGLIEAQKRFRKLRGYRTINGWLAQRSVDPTRKVG